MNRQKAPCEKCSVGSIYCTDSAHCLSYKKWRELDNLEKKKARENANRNGCNKKKRE